MVMSSRFRSTVHFMTEEEPQHVVSEACSTELVVKAILMGPKDLEHGEPSLDRQ